MPNEIDWLDLFIYAQIIGGLLLVAFMWGARKND